MRETLGLSSRYVRCLALYVTAVRLMTDGTPSQTAATTRERAGCSGAGGGVFSYAAGHLSGTFFTDGLKVSFFYS